MHKFCLCFRFPFFLAFKFSRCLLAFAAFSAVGRRVGDFGKFRFSVLGFGKQFAVKKFQSFSTIVIYAINSTRTSCGYYESARLI